VLLVFHGGGGWAGDIKRYSGIDAIADREGFVAVYPNGTGRWGRRLLTFNAGTCCGYARDLGVDDVGFALALLDDLERRAPVAVDRVYATGHSNGAMMAYRLALAASDRIAAVVAVAGGVVTDFAPTGPVPVLHIHSVDDPRALYGGGLGPPFPLTNQRVEHPAVDSVVAHWRAAQNCPEDPEVVDTRRASAADGSPHTATLFVWRPCAEGTEVALWKLTGAGHHWPGTADGRLERFVGPGTTVIDASEEVWRFVSRFTH
jgi:polyhydroxybutyrate depolymerase